MGLHACVPTPDASQVRVAKGCRAEGLWAKGRAPVTLGIKKGDRECSEHAQDAENSRCCSQECLVCSLHGAYWC